MYQYLINHPKFLQHRWHAIMLPGLLGTVGLALVTYKVGWLSPFLVVILLVAIPIGIVLLSVEWFGVYVMVAIAFLMNTFLKLIPNLPIGILMDLIIVVMFLSMLYHLYWNNQWKNAFGSPFTWVILLWSSWHLIEFANPIAASRVAWFYVMRPALGYILIFFITYYTLHNLADIKRLLFFIALLTAVSATWGVLQFALGYFPFEMRYIVQHDAVHLVFIQGRWRSFGTMGSPAHYGVIMAYMTVACFLMLGVRYAGWQKLLLIITAALTLSALTFSGARSGYAVLPISLMVVVGLSGNVKLYIMSGIAGVLLGIVIAMPSDNYHIQRIQSTFKASEDESFNIREENRKMITPWIMAHPMGGGLGSTGVWGQRFSPGTFLANFPPDSGYVRVAVEMGWIGLLLYAILWSVILWHGIFGFLQLRTRCRNNPQEITERRLVALAILASIVPLTVVEMAQDIVGKLPSNLLFWIWLALLAKTVQPDVQEKVTKKIYKI